MTPGDTVDADTDPGQPFAIVDYLITTTDLGSQTGTNTPPNAQLNAAPVIDCTPATGSQFPIGTTTVNCTSTSTDAADNTSTASFVVNVTDTTIATFTVTAINPATELPATGTNTTHNALRTAALLLLAGLTLAGLTARRRRHRTH